MPLPLFIRNRSFRFKILSLVAFTGLLALCGLGSVSYIYNEADVPTLLMQTMGPQVAMLARELSTPVIAGDTGRAETELASLRLDPKVQTAVIYDSEKRPLASFRKNTAAGRTSMPFRPVGKYVSGNDLILSRPILLHGQPIGIVEVAQSFSAIAKSRWHFIVVVCSTFVASFSLAFVVATRLQRSFTAPLAELSDLARSVSKDKDYSIRASRRSGDEVGLLVDSFNEMLRQIQIRQEAQASAELSLRESEERFALAARGANDGLWDWRQSTGLMYVSPRGNQMLGFDELEKHWAVPDWMRHVHPSDRKRVASEWYAILRSGKEVFASECRMRHRNGSSIWVLSRGRAVRDAKGKVIRMAGSLTDITNGKVADSLTGLHSRFYFIDRLDSVIEASRDSEARFAILFLDLDRFKIVNDTLGHAAGDELLIEIAQRIRLAAQTWNPEREQSIAARLGGDEFAILL